MTEDDEREQDYDNGRASPDGGIVAAASAVVLVGVRYLLCCVALRCARA